MLFPAIPIALLIALLIDLWPWNLFGNAHSRGEYLCQVSLISLDHQVTEISRNAKWVSMDNGRPAARTAYPKI